MLRPCPPGAYRNYRNGKPTSRRLSTKRLVSLLRSIFGRAYYSRTSNRSSSRYNQRKSPRAGQRIEPKNVQQPANTTFMPISALNNNFPSPLQAPPQWLNPAYWNAQISCNGQKPVSNNGFPPVVALKQQPQQAQRWATNEIMSYGAPAS